MSHEVRLWAVPLIAIILGLLVYFGSKDGKTAGVGGFVALSGIAILLWVLTFGLVIR